MFGFQQASLHSVITWYSMDKCVPLFYCGSPSFIFLVHLFLLSWMSLVPGIRSLPAQSWRTGMYSVPAHRPSAKVARLGSQLATMAAFKIKTVTIPKGGLHSRSCHPNLGRQCIWAELHETGGLSAILAVNRLGRCRATRPSRLQRESIYTQNRLVRRSVRT